MVCIVYDVSNKDSFGHCKFWYDKVLEAFPNDKKVIGKIYFFKVVRKYNFYFTYKIKHRMHNRE